MEFTRVRIKCDNPMCGRFFFANKKMYRDQCHKFCKVCKRFHSYKVLVQQVFYKESLMDRVIRVAQDFKAPYVLADALEISPPTLYRWLRHYFKMSFADFRDIYILNRTEGKIMPADPSEYHESIVQLAPIDLRTIDPTRTRVESPEEALRLPPPLPPIPKAIWDVYKPTFTVKRQTRVIPSPPMELEASL
jgi:hypothetical protein